LPIKNRKVANLKLATLPCATLCGLINVPPACGRALPLDGGELGQVALGLAQLRGDALAVSRQQPSGRGQPAGIDHPEALLSHYGR
jgi:hypothetical protein